MILALPGLVSYLFVPDLYKGNYFTGTNTYANSVDPDHPDLNYLQSVHDFE